MEKEEVEPDYRTRLGKQGGIKLEYKYTIGKMDIFTWTSAREWKKKKAIN